MVRLKLLRLSAGLSQWEVSRAAGMSQGRYSMIERTLISPTTEERETLGRALGAPPASLFRSVIVKSRGGLRPAGNGAELQPA
jgi:transcriptional regulator with XRE-family HTH domain